MTLGEVNEYPKLSAGNMSKLSEALKDALIVARKEGRITCGIYASAMLMEVCPEQVMFCVLPVSGTEDVANEIQYTLIEAFCWENDIRMIKVDSKENLAKLLQEGGNDNDAAGGRRAVEDFSCVLVQFADGYLVTKDEEEVLCIYQLCCETQPHPYISLPA